MRNMILTLLLLATPSAFADEFKLVINGPDEIKVGKIAIFTTEGTTATAFYFIKPRELEDNVFECQERNPGKLMVFPDKAGVYRLILSGVGGNAEDGFAMNHIDKYVKVTGADIGGPTPPPPPPPPAGFKPLEELSRSLSTGLGDEQTRAKLGMRLMGVQFTGTPEEVDKRIDQVVRRVLAERPRDNTTDWDNGWYSPIVVELSKLVASGSIKDLSDLKAAVKAIATGLQT